MPAANKQGKVAAELSAATRSPIVVGEQIAQPEPLTNIEDVQPAVVGANERQARSLKANLIQIDDGLMV